MRRPALSSPNSDLWIVEWGSLTRNIVEWITGGAGNMEHGTQWPASMQREHTAEESVDRGKV